MIMDWPYDDNSKEIESEECLLDRINNYYTQLKSEKDCVGYIISNISPKTISLNKLESVANFLNKVNPLLGVNAYSEKKNGNKLYSFKIIKKKQ